MFFHGRIGFQRGRINANRLPASVLLPPAATPPKYRLVRLYRIQPSRPRWGRVLESSPPGHSPNFRKDSESATRHAIALRIQPLQITHQQHPKITPVPRWVVRRASCSSGWHNCSTFRSDRCSSISRSAVRRTHALTSHHCATADPKLLLFLPAARGFPSPCLLTYHPSSRFITFFLTFTTGC